MHPRKFQKTCDLIDAGAMGLAVTFICGFIYLIAFIVALLNLEDLPDHSDEALFLLAFFIPVPGVTYAVLNYHLRSKKRRHDSMISSLSAVDQKKFGRLDAEIVTSANKR